MRLKSISLNLEAGLLSQADVKNIWREIKLDTPTRLVVGIDGPPGTGKSVLGEALQKLLMKKGIPSSLIQTDLNCLPRAERPKHSNLMDWTGSELVREVLTHPGANFLYNGYDPVTHARTRVAQIFSPKRGVLIIEGLKSVEQACRFSLDPVVAI